MYKNARKCTKICENVQKYAKMYKNMRKTCNTNVQKYAKLYAKIRGCLEAADGLAGNSRRHRSGGGIGAAAADVEEAAGGGGRSLTAAADALGAAGGEGVSHRGRRWKYMQKKTKI